MAFYQLYRADDQLTQVTPRFTATTLANAQTVAQSIATILGVNVVLAALEQGAAVPTAMGAVVHSVGTGGVVTLTGTPAATVQSLEIDVVLGGSNTTATFSWKINGYVQANNVAMAASVLLGATGITANFAAGTYVPTDVYTAQANLPVPQPWTAYTAGGQGGTVSAPSGISY
jgi:hypothetical protein